MDDNTFTFMSDNFTVGDGFKLGLGLTGVELLLYGVGWLIQDLTAPSAAEAKATAAAQQESDQRLAAAAKALRDEYERRRAVGNPFYHIPDDLAFAVLSVQQDCQLRAHYEWEGFDAKFQYVFGPYERFMAQESQLKTEDLQRCLDLAPQAHLNRESYRELKQLLSPKAVEPESLRQRVKLP